MSKFIFICEDEPMPFADAIVTKKTFEFNADHLGGVIGEFETFLKGCGYHIDGHLEIYKHEDSSFEKNNFGLSKDGELDLEARQPFDSL
jgi:hypothetical protein